MMEFPAYVPAAVRIHLENILEGEPERGIPGYVGLLEKAKQTLAAVSESLERKTFCGEDEYLDGLRIQRADAAEHFSRLSSEVDCLRRLSHDDRMRDAFAILTQEIATDEQWQRFILAAWAARVDFAKYRDRLKRAAELKGEIAGAAETLAKLIRQFSDTGINGH